MRKHIPVILLLIMVGEGLVAQNILGIDVSHYNGTINWTQVSAAGKVFAWTKATEGVSYTDATLTTYMANGTSAGVVMGVYHFARPETNSAVDEANYFLSVAGSYIGAGYLPPALDFEDPPSGPGLTSAMSSAALTAWAQTWMSTVQNATGIAPVIYTSGSIASYVNSSLNTYKLWIANPGTSATTQPSNIGVWNTWAFKQYSWTGTVSGISGSVDLDVYNGTATDFNNLIGTNPCTSPVNDNCPGMPITSNGNCLTGTVACATGSYGANQCTGCACTSTDDYDVYYSFVAAASSETVTLSNYSNNFDAVIELRNTCASGGNIGCFDSSGIPSSVSHTWTNLTIGQTYYIRVFEYNYSSTPPSSPTFDICLTHTVCTSPAQPGAITGNAVVCSGNSQTYSIGAVSGATSCTWTYTGTGSISGTGTSVTFNPTGSGTLSVKANNSCGSSAVTTFAITVNPLVTPTINITANPTGAICSGTNVTFTAVITNGGVNPVYTWKQNGIAVGTNSSNYSSSALANGDVIYCSLTSNASCLSSNSASSNSIAMIVNAPVTPAVSISTNTGISICTGQSVTFTAAPTNGGNSPMYQWKLNGNNISTGSTYTTTLLNDGDVISCLMTSSLANCVTQSAATSNSLTMGVNSSVAPAISFAPNTMSICAGTSVTLTPSYTGGGSSPVFHWKRNGIDISGATNSSYTSSGFSDGDLISCQLTSSASCANPATVMSANSVLIFVTQPVTPIINININSSDTVCAGALVSISSAISNGGTSPAYQWKLNGVNISGAISSVYSSSSLLNGDVVTCELISNAACAAVTNIVSNAIPVNISPVVTPVVSITSSQGLVVCQSTNVVFNASSINAGNAPVYQWKVNGNNVSAGNSYATSLLNNGDAVSCVMSSSLACVTDTFVNSNTLQMTVNSSLILAVQLNNCEMAATYFSNISYQWYIGSSLIPNATTRFYTASQSGYYYVIVTDSNLCNSQSADVFVNYPACLPNGVVAIKEDLSFDVYELSNCTWQVTVSSFWVGKSIDVFNAQGQIVLKSTIKNQQSTIDASPLASGIYFVRMADGEGKYNVKKVVKN